MKAAYRWLNKNRWHLLKKMQIKKAAFKAALINAT